MLKIGRFSTQMVAFPSKELFDVCKAQTKP